ncbi:MAG: ABC transporter ATP-binding protein, partial [Spirochaetaceae bacterium]
MGRKTASDTTTAPIIEAENLSFRYGTGPLILDGLSFGVPRGSFLTFIGPSGSGKTTLLHILGGMYRRYEGRLAVHSDHLSFVFQDESLLEWKTALQNVLLPFEISGFPEDARERARRILALVGLAGYEQFYPAELSGGMKKRVELARALVTEPDLLILDEPFSSLDLLTRERLNVLLRAIHRRTRCTVVLVTHSVEEACYLSDRIMVLSAVPARIVAVESVDRPERPAVGNTAATVSEDEEVFVLSEAEYRANRDLRSTARSLWRRSPADGEETPPVSSIPPSGRGPAPGGQSGPESPGSHGSHGGPGSHGDSGDRGGTGAPGGPG